MRSSSFAARPDSLGGQSEQNYFNLYQTKYFMQLHVACPHDSSRMHLLSDHL